MEHRQIERCITPIWYVLGAAFAIRAAIPLFVLIWSQDYSAFYEVYTPECLQPGEELLVSGRFSTDGRPEVCLTPAYPLFLIPGLLLRNVPLFTIPLQIVLSCLTVYLVFRIALLVFEKVEIATCCAGVYAIEPLSVIFSSLLMPETLLTFAVCVFLFFLARYFKTGVLTDLIVCAAAAAACAYVSPKAYFLPVVLALFLFVRVLKRQTGTSWIHVIVFLIVSMSLVGLWQVRNRIETGYFGFSTTFTNSLYYGQAAAVIAEKEGKTITEAQLELRQRAAEYAADHPESAVQLRFLRNRAAEIILSNPFTYAKIYVQGMIRTLVGLGAHACVRLLDLLPPVGKVQEDVFEGEGLMETLMENYGELSRGVVLVTIILGLLTAFFYFFAVVAIFSRDFVWNWFMITVLGVALYLLLVAGGPEGYSRYRHPIMPIISIFTGYGLFVTGRRVKAKRAPG